LLKVAAETLITIAPTGQARGLKAHDPKHLGARIGLTAVLHTWGSALTHHPHAHIIVPGGGFSPDRQHWIPCRPGFFLPVRVLSRLFRRLFLEKLTAAFETGHLEFFADHAALAEPTAFKAYLDPLRQTEWVVYSKRPFGGPDAVLAYLSAAKTASSPITACSPKSAAAKNEAERPPRGAALALWMPFSANARGPPG
jgi:Putative transposase